RAEQEHGDAAHIGEAKQKSRKALAAFGHADARVIQQVETLEDAGGDKVLSSIRRPDRRAERKKRQRAGTQQMSAMHDDPSTEIRQAQRMMWPLQLFLPGNHARNGAETFTCMKMPKVHP